MKATDLILGDIVSHNGEVKIVTSIPTEHKVALQTPHQQYGSIYDTTPLDEVEPQAITYALLNRFDFDHIGDDCFEWDNTEFTVTFDFSTYALVIEQLLGDGKQVYLKNRLVDIPCTEMHTLRHALLLAGLDIIKF